MGRNGKEDLGHVPDDKDDDRDYSHLTLLEKRDKNIERNNRYYLTLFGSSVPESVVEPDVIEESDRTVIVENTISDEDKLDAVPDYHSNRKEKLSAFSTLYPHRFEEIETVLGYLNPVSSCQFQIASLISFMRLFGCSF